MKQVERCWYQTFTAILVELRFSQCSVDKAVYHKSDTAAHKLMVIAVDRKSVV